MSARSGLCLSLFALLGVCEAAETTIVRSWRYTYEVPAGFTYNSAILEDFGETGIAVLVRVEDPDTWYQAIWLDGAGGEVWKSPLRASIVWPTNSIGIVTSPVNGFYYSRNITDEDDDYRGENEGRVPVVVLKAPDETISVSRFDEYLDGLVASEISRETVDQIKADGYSIWEYTTPQSLWGYPRDYDPSDHHNAPFFAWRWYFDDTLATAIVFGRDYLALGPVTPAGEPLPITLDAEVVTGVEGENLIIRWKGRVGTGYQVQVSTNLEDWGDEGESLSGTGGVLQWSSPITAGEDRYLRVVATE